MMKFITVHEAAQQWNLNVRTVQIYCKTHKIPGAKQIGRQWFVPVDAEKPFDGRTKTMRESPDYSSYHFPVFVYSEFFADQSGLSPDEITLLKAQTLFLQGKFMQSLEICKKLIARSFSPSVRFGAYAANGFNYILLGRFTEVSVCLAAMERIRDDSPDHAADYNLVIDYFRFLCTFNTKYLENDVDIHRLSNEALDTYELIAVNVILFEKSSISPDVVKHIEIFCRRMENMGIIPTAMILHGQLALMYSQFGENKSKRFHMKEATRIGYENQFCTTLSRVSIIKHPEYMELFRAYGEDFAEKAHKVHISNKRNLAANLKMHSPEAPAGKLNLLDATEWEFLIMLSNGFSDEQIAKVKDIFPDDVTEKISEFCERLELQSREELVQFTNSCFMPQEGDFELLPK